MSVSPTRAARARCRPAAFRVNSTDVASAQELPFTAAGRPHEHGEQGREEAQQPSDDEQEGADEQAHDATSGGVVAVGPDECPVPPALDDDPQEPVRDKGHQADHDRNVQGVAGIQVADVAQFVADDRLELLPIHLFQQAARDRQRGVSWVPASRERVLAPILDGVCRRDRDVRRDREFPDHVE